MQQRQTSLSASLGDYLKVIHKLSEEHGSVHAGDISKALSVSRPSVTGALRLLAARGMIAYEPYSPIALTERGRVAAKDLLLRFTVLRDFLVDVLQIEDPEAEHAACAAEHVLSPNVFNRLTAFLEYAQRCPRRQLSFSGEEGGFQCGENVSEGCAGCASVQHERKAES